MSFQPKFEWINCKTAEETFAEVASKINRPHEDYPKRVNSTLEVMRQILGADFFISFDARTIHSIIFPGFRWSGQYRDVNVKIGQDNPPSFLQVPNLIEKIFPVKKGDDLTEWYRKFQMIHPFQDGNGRTAGVIVAVLSWDGDKMLSPLQ